MYSTNRPPDRMNVQKPADLAAYIDHTLLKPDATTAEIRQLCEEAKKHNFKAVCVNPIFIRETRRYLETSPVLTAAVIGFPLGASVSRVKALETELAISDGASEIDMVIRLDLVKEARWTEARKDIQDVVRAAGGNAVKVILETGLLSPDEIQSACRVSEEAGAHFVKTATGFLGRGATIDDIELMKRSCSAQMEIKASGGIKTFLQAQQMISSGATRIGTSSGVSLVTGTSTPASSY